MIGELIDHYRVLEVIGRGAMGVVYKALDVNLDRRVAIKLMGSASRDDSDFVERFRQEARLQAALNHPNVALLFDYFVHEGAPVAVMEFIDGESLEQLIRRRGLVPAYESIPLFKQALRGVAAAHRAGIIHRDLKPSNLMITKDGIVKVMDFGIAKREGATGATKASTSIGSPLYMAPEQILGRTVDCRTDVYALGITLYQLLSGQLPFNPRGKTEYSVLNAHVNELPEPPTVHCREIPGPVVDAVLRALSKEPDDRFKSADDFMRALPDVPAPSAEAPPGDPSHTVALEYSPSMSGDQPPATREPTRTMAFEYGTVGLTLRNPHDSMAFDYSAATLQQELHPRRSGPSSATTASPPVASNVPPAGTPVSARPSNKSTRSFPVPSSSARSPAAQGSRGALPGLMQFLRAHRPAIVVVLVAALVLGALIRYAERPRATVRDASLPSSGSRVMDAQALSAARTPTRVEPATPSPAVPRSSDEAPVVPPADVTVETSVPPTGTPLPARAMPTRQDLSGIWRGEYVDASGKQLLRVVSLSISRVHDDGGIEGALQYEAASGDGECKLRPPGSTYWPGAQRLQLSPVGCSPHYPKELGVPLDFDRVNPWANTLKDGRIEAPTGEVIRVKLKRVRGV
jgi:serine/threonine protein kinase